MSLTALWMCGFLAFAQGEQKPGKFSEAELFLELNATDGDLGLHALIDGEPWTALEIDGPGPGELLHIVSRGQLRAHGLTEITFESAEPSFDELTPDEILARFPEGKYRFSARALEGGTLAATDRLSHVLAAPPTGVALNGTAAAETCDAEPLPVVAAPVTASWEPVTSSHPTIGRSGAVEITRYQFFVSAEARNLGVDLPPHVTEFEIPEAFTPKGKAIKFEIIARTKTGNNTAVESCFIVQ
jgi:hypothetical protein